MNKHRNSYLIIFPVVMYLLFTSCSPSDSITHRRKFTANEFIYFERKSDLLLKELTKVNVLGGSSKTLQAIILIDTINRKINEEIKLFPSNSNDIGLGKMVLQSTGPGQEFEKLMSEIFSDDSIYIIAPNLFDYKFDNRYWIERFCYKYPDETKLELAILKYELLLFEFYQYRNN